MNLKILVLIMTLSVDFMRDAQGRRGPRPMTRPKQYGCPILRSPCKSWRYRSCSRSPDS